ncbi:MAG: glycine/sarcosine/betaine reductase selenoprotein B family protein [Pyrinomonadaceae bacterium]
MELIENLKDIESRYSKWQGDDSLKGYPFVENRYAPFTPARRALPMLNLALITSAGAYVDGTSAFQSDSWDGDTSYREIPVEIEAEDLKFAGHGYDTAAVMEDLNAQIPIDRLIEYENNAVIGRLNHVWWSTCGWIKNASAVASDLAPNLAARLSRYEVQAALLIPASRLCHQTLGIVAREIEEKAGIPTMLISVDRSVTDLVRAPRTAYYSGEFGSVAGKAGWPEYQRRVLDESLRWIETFDQPGSRKLAVEIETATEMARGER